MLWVPERESYRIQIPKFLTLRGCFSWICSPSINSYPPHHCPSCSSAPYTHLVQADDLTVGLLDLAQLGEEVPETRLGDDIVWCKDTHAVELWGWVGVTWEMTANDLVLDQALVAGACRLNCWRTISALSDSRIGKVVSNASRPSQLVQSTLTLTLLQRMLFARAENTVPGPMRNQAHCNSAPVFAQSLLFSSSRRGSLRNRSRGGGRRVLTHLHNVSTSWHTVAGYAITYC